MENIGVVSNLAILQKTSKAGASYSVYSFNLSDGSYFKEIYPKTKIRLANGMSVRIVTVLKAGSSFKDYEVYEHAAAASSGGPPAPTAPAAPFTPSYGKSSDQQASIVRQFALREGVQIVKLLVEAGSIAKTVLKDESAVVALIGHYASIVHDAVQNDQQFEALQSFTGHINEVGTEAEAA